MYELNAIHDRSPGLPSIGNAQSTGTATTGAITAGRRGDGGRLPLPRCNTTRQTT